MIECARGRVVGESLRGPEPGKEAEGMNRDELAGRLEQSLLRPGTTRIELECACEAAVRNRLGALVVQPHFLPAAVAALEGTTVRPASVLSFPHGADLPAVKAYAAANLRTLGAAEIDMVMNLGLFASDEWGEVEADVAGVVRAAAGARVKVILETALWSDAQIVRACRICRDAGAHYVKTSTGFGPEGATTERVALIRRTVGSRMGVKASGGIRTLDRALAMWEAGADRIGTSSAEAILAEWDGRFRA